MHALARILVDQSQEAGTQRRSPSWVAGTQLLRELLAAFQDPHGEGTEVGSQIQYQAQALQCDLGILSAMPNA